MNDKEKERVECCVVQIECIYKLNSEDVELGTGFFIEDNIIVTASHVINKYYENPLEYEIYVIPVKSEIDRMKVKRVIEIEKNNFVSILELEKKIDTVNPLKFKLGYKIKRGDKYFSFGHPRCRRLYGHQVENEVATKINGNQSIRANWELKLSGERVEDFEGYSGSPVIIDNMLVGIVQTESNSEGKTIAIGMASVDIMKRFISDKYCDISNIKEINKNNDTNGCNNVTDMEFIRKISICKTIKRLLIENHRTFIEYGPRSENAKNNPMSNIYEIWKIRKGEKIVPNNSKIIKLINENKELFDFGEYEACCEFIEHAEGFERSCNSVLENIKIFPKEFEEVIDKYVKV